MKHMRIVSVGIVVFAAACTHARDERPATQSQPLDEEDGGGTPACAHPICAAGEQLDAACDPCATKVCTYDPYCCGVAWDETCVSEVASICGLSCTRPPQESDDGGAEECVHPICATGGPLTSGCDACVTTLCTQDPYCCAVEWDATCVGEVTSICNQSCN